MGRRPSAPRTGSGPVERLARHQRLFRQMGNTLILPGLMRVLHHDHITLRHAGRHQQHTGRHIRRDLDDGRPRR